MAAKTDINVVPLIDIVLVLLIIFIVMVPGMQKSLPTVIPEVRQDIEPPKNKPEESLALVLDIKPDNTLELNKQPIARLGDIPEILTDQISKQPIVGSGRRVILNVDCCVPYQWVVQVMDQIKVASEKVKYDTFTKGDIFGPDGKIIDGGDTKVIVKRKSRPLDEECHWHPAK